MRIGIAFPLQACLWAALVGAGGAAHAVDLQEAYRLARDNDRQWRVARARFDESREFRPQALAQMLPQVSAGASESRVRQELSTAGIPSPEQRYPSSTRSITMRQPVMVARQLAGLEQAQARERQGEFNLREEEHQLAVRVTTAYLEWLLSHDRRRALQAQKAFVTARLDAVKAMMRAGQGTRTDVDEATAELDRLRAQEIQAEQAVALSRRKLENLIGRDAGDPAALRLERITPQSFPLPPLDQAVSQALANNAGLRGAREEVEMARAALRAAGRAHLPSLDLVAQYSNSTGENSYFASTANRNLSVGLQMQVPIYSGGLISSQERQALARQTQAEEQFEFQQNAIRVQAQTEHHAVNQGLALVTALQTAVASAEQALLSSQKGQQAGVRTNLDILRAESQRWQTQLELAEARYQLVAAWTRLQGLMGALGSDDFAKIAVWFMADTAKLPGAAGK